MPGFDQSGPMGAGPMTGGGLGCCGTPAPEYGRTGFRAAALGRGLANRRGSMGGRGSGRRMSMGYGRRFAADPAAVAGNPIDELNMLRMETDRLKESLQTVANRITEIEKLL